MCFPVVKDSIYGRQYDLAKKCSHDQPLSRGRERERERERETERDREKDREIERESEIESDF